MKELVTLFDPCCWKYCDPEVLGSLEYAGYILRPLIMVLGHERCGAVTAAVQGKRLSGHIGSLLRLSNQAIPRQKVN